MNVSGLSFRNAETSDDRIAIVDYTEENLDGQMRWGNFLTDCDDEDTHYPLFGYFDDITFHMEMNFDKGTITGSCSGSFNYDSYSWKRGLLFSGEFTGILDKYNWNYNRWFWEFGSNFSLTLTFRYEQRCTNEENEVYWNSREETIELIAELSGNSFAGRGGIGSFSVSWEDPGSGVEDSRYFRLGCKNRLDSGGCDLPADLPEVIDIDATIADPETIRNTDSSVTFDIDSSGRDLDRVNEVNWYFRYFDEEGWGDFWWFETFVKTDLSPLEIDKGKLTDWAWYVTQYGKAVTDEKRLLMQVLVELKAGENEWLFESEGYNFTYIVKQSSGFNLILDEGLEVYPTMSNETTFRLDHTGTDLSDKVTFEISETLPEYLTVEFEKKTADKSPNGIIDNKLIVSLDMSKASSLSLPTEQSITVVAKSKKGADLIETSEQITLNILPAKWLIMHYCASNTIDPLQKDDSKNIEEIITALNDKKTPKVGYILLIDLHENWKPPSYKEDTALAARKSHLLKYYDSKLELLETSNNLEMNSPSTLSNFLEKAERTIPAEKTILIISDHGEGVNGIITEAQGKIMKINELDGALNNHKLDLLVLEACRMGKLPVLYELRDKADYIISSQTNMKARSFQYTQALSPLLSDPSISTVQVGKPFIEAYEPGTRDAVSLVDTSKLEAVVQALNTLFKTIDKGITEKGEEYFNAITDCLKLHNSLHDVRCFAENLIKYDGIKDTQTKADAETLKNAVEATVISYKMNVWDELVFYSGSKRGLVLDDPPIEPETEADRIRLVAVRQFFGIGFESVKDERLEYYTTFTWPDLEKTRESARLVIKKDQKGNNLYIRVVDSEGYVNGYDPESEYKSKIELDYIQAEYIDYLNGTQVIILPSGVGGFTTVIYGGLMEETDESYSITYTLIEDNKMVTEQTIENPIHEYTEHSVHITVSEGQIEIGEKVVTELEVEQEPEPDPEPEPEEETDKPGGIPGFNTESVLMGIVISVMVIWLMSKRARALVY